MTKIAFSITIERRAPRHAHAVAARQRHAGPMKDRRCPRGGAQNEQRALLAELAEFEELDEVSEPGKRDSVRPWNRRL